MRLGIGTAQFGMDYGVSNGSGQTPLPEVARIISHAAVNGIRVIDTAAVYGTSEEAIGGLLPGRHKFSIITKTIGFAGPTITPRDADMLEVTFMRSLARLKQKSVYALLLHNSDNLFMESSRLLLKRMFELREKGLVKRIGASVYNGKQVDQLIKCGMDIVQAPLNVFDQRLAADGYLYRLKDAGFEVHARSVFLQGLLLLEPDRLDPFFGSLSGRLAAFHEAAGAYGMTPLEASLSFVLRHKEIDRVIVGVCSREELEEVMKAYRKASGLVDCSGFSLRDERMINPANWKICGKTAGGRVKV